MQHAYARRPRPPRAAARARSHAASAASSKKLETVAERPPPPRATSSPRVPRPTSARSLAPAALSLRACSRSRWPAPRRAARGDRVGLVEETKSRPRSSARGARRALKRASRPRVRGRPPCKSAVVPRGLPGRPRAAHSSGGARLPAAGVAGSPRFFRANAIGEAPENATAASARAAPGARRRARDEHRAWGREHADARTESACQNESVAASAAARAGQPASLLRPSAGRGVRRQRLELRRAQRTRPASARAEPCGPAPSGHAAQPRRAAISRAPADAGLERDAGTRSAQAFERPGPPDQRRAAPRGHR